MRAVGEPQQPAASSSLFEAVPAILDQVVVEGGAGEEVHEWLRVR
jgi:hypothetical protein